MLQKQNSPTQVQERIISALFILQNIAEREGGVKLHFSGSAIARVLGGAWSTYRRREIIKMVNLGIVDVVHSRYGTSVFTTVNFYALKENWREWCRDAYAPKLSQVLEQWAIEGSPIQEGLPF